MLKSEQILVLENCVILENSSLWQYYVIINVIHKRIINFKLNIMKKIVCLLVTVLCTILLYSQEKKVSMYNEVAMDATIGGYGTAMPSALFSYTGGVNASKYFSAGVTLGYDPWRGMALSALKVKGMAHLEKIHFYASANGGIRTTFEEVLPALGVSVGIGFKSKQHVKRSFNLGPVMEFARAEGRQDWAPFVGLRLGYQF